MTLAADVALPLLVLRNVALRYDSVDDGPGAVVLRGVDLEVRAGESLAIVGPSGSGKSSLLHIIGGLLAPTEGDVIFDGVAVSGLKPRALAALRNERLGFVFQSHHLLPQCTALENVLVPTLVHRDDALRRSAPERAKALLSAVGLSERFSHRPAQLSGGECQRVAVVRALINQPRLVLADEPTGSLDGEAADHLGEMLATLNAEQGVALITVTHSDRLAAKMGSTYALREGRLSRSKATP